MFTARYDAVTDSVDPLQGRQQSSAKGVRIVAIAIPPGGVSGASGVLLDGGDRSQARDKGVVNILPRGRRITRG